MDTKDLEALNLLHCSPIDENLGVLSPPFPVVHNPQTEHAPLRVPVLRISVADVLLPTLTTWGQPVRNSRIQLQREVFSPKFLSLAMSFEGTMVLNAEL